MTDVFGSVHLGYLVVESRKMSEWQRFGRDAIGMHIDVLSPEVTRFRLDDRECRFLIQKGDREDVTALGWQVDDHETFDVILGRVVEAGIPVIEGTPEECALRGVERLWRFAGPKGMATEIFTTPLTTSKPLMMLNSAFVTGASGMGHVAIASKDAMQMHGYYSEVFDARLTDFIEERVGPISLRIRFLRVNERHHSIALANVKGLAVNPIPSDVQHVNIQVAELDDMVGAFERVTAEGFKMMWTVGQHTNDRELSFYCVTPSGFELEVGWNPVLITPEVEATWEPSTYQGISIWGHTPVGETVLHKMNMFRTMVRSKMQQEMTVPELSPLDGIPS
ncbi:VOC family protein [Rhodococcus rhodochrous]|uniref:VOC family protein n=1 Tax=Rhodococcus rhodochrous TaxID=1829 RepID=A0AA46WWI5_RHORH|nr:VOC family protein [Rhodococcus rhodochrous]UZF45731.1 VOC family protein [Rhodococcus rhodochrous]